MKRHLGRGLMAAMAIWLAVVTCNLPSNRPQATTELTESPQGVAYTAAALALTAQGNTTPSPESLTPAAAEPTATACSPIVTANLNANVRSGPSTDYDIVGYLPAGGTAPVAGKNDAGTWWYIEFAGGTGGHAWIAGSVTTSSCLPATLSVIAAPPLPTAVPPTDTEEPPPAPAAKPDLIISEFTISPATPIQGQPAHVRIGAYNQGNAAAGQFVVQWYGLSTFSSPSCTWTVNHSNAHGGHILECDFTFSSWYPTNKTSLAIVDANHQVDESNESNNQGTISPFGVNKP